MEVATALFLYCNIQIHKKSVGFKLTQWLEDSSKPVPEKSLLAEFWLKTEVKTNKHMY